MLLLISLFLCARERGSAFGLIGIEKGSSFSLSLSVSVCLSVSLCTLLCVSPSASLSCSHSLYLSISFFFFSLYHPHSIICYPYTGNQNCDRWILFLCHLSTSVYFCCLLPATSIPTPHHLPPTGIFTS